MANQAAAGNPLEPTFYGFISCTMDALILFEATLSGILHHVPRRPHDRERNQLIQSGNVFIYEEHSSGIKRWTDGVPWSPSRILGNFLLYRELDKPFQPGEKKRAMKRHKPEGITKPAANHNAFGPRPLHPQAMTPVVENGANEDDRPYLGSLVDSYQFKDDGLIKKTISITYRNVAHHIVSYYTLADAKYHKLLRVRDFIHLRDITPRQALLSSSHFRAPIDDNFGYLDPGQYAQTSVNIYEHSVPMNRALPAPPAPPAPPALPAPPVPQMQHGQGWAPEQFQYSPGYAVPNVAPPPTVQYGHQYQPEQQEQLMPAYPIGAAYPAQHASGFDPAVQPPRRHPAMPSTNGTGHLGYPPQILTNGGDLASHGLSGSPFLTGGMFDPHGANSAGDSNSPCSSGANRMSDTMNRTNGANGVNAPVPHNTSGFGGQLSAGYGVGMDRLSLDAYGGPLPDPVGSGFGPTTPIVSSATNIGLGLEHAGLSQSETQETQANGWHRTMMKDSDKW